jgi:hypothetical protein
MKKNLVVLGENIKVVVTSDQKSDWIAASILSPEFFSATEDCVKKKKQEVLARYDN